MSLGTLLQTLNFWGADRSYRYAPLKKGSGQFRLFTILPDEEEDEIRGGLTIHHIRTQDEEASHPSWEPESNDPNISWEALSYVWGTKAPNKLIYLEDRTLLVTESLHEALRALRLKKEPRVIWADQICVNQADLEERSDQVQNTMRPIFQKAKAVVAWLGQGSLELKAFFELFHRLDKDLRVGPIAPSYPAYFYENVEEVYSELDPDLSTDLSWDDDFRQKMAEAAFRALLSHPWFFRVWILQEAVLNSKLYLHYGDRYSSWDHIKKVLINNNDFEIDNEDHILWDGIKDLLPFYAMHDLRILYNPKMKAEEYVFSLLSLLIQAREMLASDARDKIFALLGLVPSHLDRRFYYSRFTIDYTKSVSLSYIEFAIWHMETYDSLDILSVECSICRNSKPEIQLPSWAVDWSEKGKTKPMSYRSPLRMLAWKQGEALYSAALEKPPRIRYLEDNQAVSIAGIKFDVVREVVKQRFPDFRDVNYTAEFHNIVLKDWPLLLPTAGEQEGAAVPNPYHDLEGREGLTEVFWRTIIADRDFTNSPKHYRRAPSEFAEQYRALRTMIEVEEENIETTPFTVNLAYSTHQKLFRTERGYLGLTHDCIQAGDVVCILWGAVTPLILRPTGFVVDPDSAVQSAHESENPTFVRTWTKVGGDCYVHGIMDGEGVALAQGWRGVQEEEFWIV